MRDDEKTNNTGANVPANPSGEASPENPQSHRRGALRKLLAGGGLVIGAESIPGAWKKPVVETVILPAHAQTTSAVEFGGPIGIEDSSILERVILPSYAGDDFSGGCVHLTIDGETVKALIQMAGGIFFKTTGKIVRSAFSMFFNAGDTIVGKLISTDGVIIRIEGDVNGISFTATPGGAGSCPKDVPDTPEPTTTVAPTTTLDSSTSTTTPSPSTSDSTTIEP